MDASLTVPPLCAERAVHDDAAEASYRKRTLGRALLCAEHAADDDAAEVGHHGRTLGRASPCAEHAVDDDAAIGRPPRAQARPRAALRRARR